MHGFWTVLLLHVCQFGLLTSSESVLLRRSVSFETRVQRSNHELISSVLEAIDDRLRAVNLSNMIKAIDDRLRSIDESLIRISSHLLATKANTSSPAAAAISSCADIAAVNAANGSATFTSNGKFVVPFGVRSVRVLVVGGGAGGGSGHAGGGGSGYVQVGVVAVEPCERITIRVGKGGQGSASSIGNTQTAFSGESSAFGHYLTANGGVAPTSNQQGAAGGSGGGGPSIDAWSGAGGSDGSAGANAWRSGGGGQGTYLTKLSLFKQHFFSPGSGGAGGYVAVGHCGGGGGGGVLMNESGPAGSNGRCARGGEGYGAGGGGGHWLGNQWYGGGNGAAGLVYVEW